MPKDILPTPSGWKILIQKKTPKKKSMGGILLPDSTVDAENFLTICAQIVRIGAMCWCDRDTGEPWTGGPWAKVGDWVIVPKFTQFKLSIDDEEYRFINDDEVIAVVPDPTKIKVLT